MSIKARTAIEVILAYTGLILLLLIAVMLTGCTTQMVRSLSKDPAVVRIKVVHPWGNIEVERIGNQTNHVQVTADGSITTGKAQ